MYTKHHIIYRTGLILMMGAAFFVGLSLWQVNAQTTDPLVTETPSGLQATPPTNTPEPLGVTAISPNRITSGMAAIVDVTGFNFTPTTTGRLLGVPSVASAYVSPTQIKIAIPADLAIGDYTIEVSDPLHGSATSPVALTIVAPAVIPPTLAPLPTLPPPTPEPGQPALLVRNFTANPSTVKPGDTVAFTFEIINQGNRAAQGIAITVDTGGSFFPATGQASVTLPDLGPGGITTTTISATIATTATDGPNTASITMNYRDFSGQIYSSKGTMGVIVKKVAEVSQVTLARYIIDPNPAEPGKPVTVTALLTNTGNKTASQVLIRVSGNDNLLLAGPAGDTFPVGDLAPGTSASVDLPLIVSAGAKSGPQAQPITITYLQDAESEQITSSMTIDVAKITLPEPLMLLRSYETGNESLQPGQEFTLTMGIENVGTADAVDMLITFGTVESSGGSGSDGGSGTDNSRTSTTPSSTFAPLGSGGTLYVGTVPASGGITSVTQDFIVNGTVDSGIYNLPITLRYQKSDGSTAQDSLRASLVVIVPPTLQIDEQSFMPESINVGEPLPIALQILNRGKKNVNFTTMQITAENAEVVEGADFFMGPLRVDEDTTVGGMVIPSGEGKVTVTVTFNYIDDLNNPRTIVETFETEAVEPPPPPDVEMPSEDFLPLPPPEEPDNSEELLGKLLLGLLGLGS